MASLFLNFIRRQIDSRPSDFEIHYKPIKTSPPVHASSTVFCLLALLAVPSFAVASWVLENTFFSTTAFSWKAFGDLVLPLGVGIFAGAVSTFRNPMHSLLSLLGVFFCTALLYLIAGIAFVGVVFLIVYVGAVAVLFLFVIMLLNVKSLTSDEPLIRHVSQIIAIVGVTLLLLQLHFILIGSLDHAFAIGFLREVILEPSTGEAISFFVRFQAMDINGLTGLYTTHGLLLMVITAVLLAALLGAIILATVTTERATSISDLRRYSKEVAPLAAAISCSFFFFVAPIESLDTALKSISCSDVDPIFLSFYYKAASRDRELRTIRNLKHDTYVTHSFQFDTRRRPLRRFLKARVSYRAIELWKVFRDHRKDVCLPIYDQIYNRRLPPKGAQHSARRKAVRAVYVAEGVLEPVLARRYRGLSAVRIMRHKWLWRWRRDRAAWLRRLTLKETKIRLTASDLEEGRHYPTFPRRKAYAPVEYRYTFFRRIIHRVKPALRLFGKRRTPFFAFLHLMLVTKVYAWIFYWAWRIRAFCSYFICFLLFLPFVTTAVWLFVDEQVVVWEALGDIHRLTAKLLHEYTDLKHVTRDFSDIVAALIIIPATVYATAVQHPYFVVGSALIFAWDAMTSHGGELSDAEFHESRCNYWRKYADDYHAWVMTSGQITFLERTQTHPDKGRSDIAPIIVVLDPGWIPIVFKQTCMYIFTYILVPIFTYIIVPVTNGIVYCVIGIFHLIKSLSETLMLPQIYEWGYGVVRAVWCYARDVPSYLFEEYPILAEWYALISAQMLTVQNWLREVCADIWFDACRSFYRIEYPHFLDAVSYRILGNIGYSIIVLSLIIATILYFVATFALLVPWQRVYQGLPVRQPSTLVYASLFVFALYVSAVLAQKFSPARHLRLFFYEFVPYDLYAAYEVYMWGHLQLIDAYPYHVFGAICFVVNFFYVAVCRWLARKCTLSGEALVFRNYYNYWLRCMRRYEESFRRGHAKELAPFFSTPEAYTVISREATAELAAADADEIAQKRRMIWIRVKYVPKYYDPHPDVKYLKHRWAYAYVVENHYKNPHHSA